VGTGAGPTPIAPTHVASDRIAFDFTVLLGDDPLPDGAPALGGAFAHGTTRDRFVYVASGRPAADGATWQWDRRAKVPLAGITAEMIDAVLADPRAVIEGRIEGTAPDGRAATARVALIEGGWRVA
jgi:hypothetical protein